MDWKQLLLSAPFWTAILALVNASLYFFVPDFPKSVWVGIDGVAAVVIAFLAAGNTKQATGLAAKVEEQQRALYAQARGIDALSAQVKK